MMIGFEKIYDWFVNVLCVLTVLFTFQLTASSVSASPIILESGHLIGTFETYTYDEYKSSAWAEIGLSRVLSKDNVGSECEVLINR